jgi:hypothetical protein
MRGLSSKPPQADKRADGFYLRVVIKLVDRHTRQAVRIAGLAACLAVAVTAPSRADEPVMLAYQVYFGGLKALALDATVDLAADRYRVRLDAHTEGFIDWLVGWTAEATSEGAIREAVVRPARHISRSVVHGTPRDVTLTFHTDGAIDAAVEPSAEADEREPVTSEQMRGALDPISAVLTAIRALGARARHSCAQRLPVFDGRRRFDLAFSDGGDARLASSPYGSFSGEATLCLFRYIRVAGYETSGRWNNPHDRDRIYRVWLAPVVRGLPPIPVRIEAEGTFGLLIVHLVSVGGRPAGAAGD